MAEEGFFKRWSRLKAAGGDAVETATPAVPPSALAPAVTTANPAPAAAPAGRPPPTLEDVARLTPDADFSAFVGQDVDKAVQRLALKKLFSDPHFKVMDGLDMYMDDYNQPSPVSAAMLAALDHARNALRLPGQLEPARAGAQEGGKLLPAASALPGEEASEAAPATVASSAANAAPTGATEPAGRAATPAALPAATPDAPPFKPAPETSLDGYTASKNPAATARQEGAVMPSGSQSSSLQGPA